ncbi:MAG: fibronectin type III domain-containing protein [Patescibacteria group bacterium]
MKKNTVSLAWSVPVAAFLAAGLLWVGNASALTAITTYLDFGARGANVTSLQQFLAADVSVYPEGLVTGYFGSLTRAAVQRYQCKQGIVCGGSAATNGYGRVGPRTLAAINASIGGTVSADVSAPAMGPVVAATTSASATFTWTTNEAARGTIYYSASPLALLEGSVGVNPTVTGQTATEAGFGFTHSVSVTGLTANTIYYFASKSEDASGNVQLTWPSTVRTGQ